MLRVYALTCIKLGEAIHDCRAAFDFPSMAATTDEEKKRQKEHRDRMNAYLSSHLEKLKKFCEDLSLSVSTDLVTQKLKHLPKSIEEFELLVAAISSEQKSRLFLYIPGHKSSFFDNKDLLDESIQKKFPSVVQDLMRSANCFALGLNTASVFHAVRAIEIGMREIARSLEVGFSFPLEQANWMEVINQMESKIKEKGKLAKSEQKGVDLHFYSEIAMQFRYFNDAWRVRVSHAREDYDEIEARAVFEHAMVFFRLISSRLSESSA